MDPQGILTALRHAILERLARSRATVKIVHQQGGPMSTLKWEQGYQAALKELLDLEGFSRRRNPRRLTALPSEIVRVEEAPGAPARTGEGTVVDLSVGGCRVATALELVPGEITELSFCLPSSDQIVTLKATVRAVDRTRETGHAGKEFQEVPENARQALEEFCAAPESSE